MSDVASLSSCWNLARHHLFHTICKTHRISVLTWRAAQQTRRNSDTGSPKQAWSNGGCRTAWINEISLHLGTLGLCLPLIFNFISPSILEQQDESRSRNRCKTRFNARWNRSSNLTVPGPLLVVASERACTGYLPRIHLGVCCHLLSFHILWCLVKSGKHLWTICKILQNSVKNKYIYIYIYNQY